MKPYHELTRLGRLRRTRQLAESALEAYGIKEAQLTFLRYFANITYRVDLPASLIDPGDAGPYAPNRFLLRILASSDWEIAQGEMIWLAALSNEAGLIVPAPMPTVDGDLLLRVQTPGIPEGRILSLMRWVKGRKLSAGFQEGHFLALGQMVGQLHAFAAGWQPPQDFKRFNWDWEGLLGGRGFSNPVDELVTIMPTDLREPFRTISKAARDMMEDLGKGSDAYGIVHGDMYAENVLSKDGNLYPIDFEDCGYGHWLWDISVALSYDPWTEGWTKQRDLFLEGYLAVHPLPEVQLAYLDLYLAAQFATEVLWATQFILNEPTRKEEHESWQEESGAKLMKYIKEH